ncbi:MAG TPA: sugar ABC transporter substrate-binding protein, partial [Actinoplanes sp.]
RSISLTMLLGETNDDAIAQAAQKGAGLVAVDSPPPPGSPIKLYIGNDNEGLGGQLADAVADRLGPTAAGKIIVGSPRNGLPQLDARAFGFRERLRVRLPKVRVIGPLDTSDRPGAADSLWAAMIKANPDAIAFASVGANGARLVKLRERLHASWLAASFDVEPGALSAVRNGTLVLVDPEHYLKGAVSGQLQAESVSKGTELPEGWLTIEGLTVTRSNVDEIIARDATDQSRQAWYATKLAQLVGAAGPKLRPLESAQ